MQPRRSLRLAHRRKGGLLGTHNGQVDTAVDDTIPEAPATPSEPGNFETPYFLKYQPPFYGYAASPELRYPTSNLRSDPSDDVGTGSADTENSSANSLRGDMEGTVRHAGYRMDCLEGNNIHFRHPSDPLPDTVAACLQQMVHTAHNAPGCTPDQSASAVHELDALGLQCYESQVACFFHKHVFLGSEAVGLEASVGVNVARHLLPCLPAARFPISQPRPDLFYGYARKPTFTQAQLLVLQRLHEQIANYAEGCLGLSFPFFSIEFKAAGGTRGDLWTAANQCAGASAACVQAIDQLNTALGEVGCPRRVPNLCYSFAVDNNIAQLYASWREENDQVIYIQRVDSFLLSSPEHFGKFRQLVLAIIAWGRTARLNDIRLALDRIAETRQRAASERAKSRLAPETEDDGRPLNKRRRQRRIL
ncbi:hypothetical protein OQA88_10300 [Cercophora sp. LCS_1]